jgi:hypothetical protein
LVDADVVQQDLERSRSLHGGVYVGDPCAKAQYFPIEKADLPLLIPHAGALPDGSCVVDGWAYFPSPPPGVLETPLMQDASGYFPIPLFGDHGELVGVLEMPTDLVPPGPVAEPPK